MATCKCGAVVGQGQLFCASCGQKVESDIGHRTEINLGDGDTTEMFKDAQIGTVNIHLGGPTGAQPSQPNPVGPRGPGRPHRPTAVPEGYGDDNTKEKIRAKKQQLANRYITDPQEKCLFLKTADNDIHDWGPYIAAVVLTRRDETPFTRADIRRCLSELIPELYDGKYARENTILPADLRLDAPVHPTKPGGNPVIPFLCLEKVGESGNGFKFKLIGFKAAITRRFGADALRQKLSDCP